VGIGHVEQGKVTYIFVIMVQRVRSEAKCSSLFIIDCDVGMANDVIQRKIDDVTEITHRRTSRVFLASDGDPPYNDRRHGFMNFWEPIYEQWGLATVLTELKGYRRILPLSDMLHLGQNLRTHFLKYLLTFSHGTFSKSSDCNKMLRLFRLGAPFTELSPVGKRPDVYPLVNTRIEHMTTMLLKDVTAEAVVGLLFSLCFNAIWL
jgi:hypothetical protein